MGQSNHVHLVELGPGQHTLMADLLSKLEQSMQNSL